MKPIQLEYEEAQGLRQLIYRLHKELAERDRDFLTKHRDIYLKMLDKKINEAVMKNA